jgi:putative nucleotidyltransferase with HDIG domain/PAS domain S-box-containing protein
VPVFAPSAPISDWCCRTLPDAATVELTPSGVIVALNDSYCDLLARGRPELLGRSPLEFTHPDDVAASQELIARLSAKPGFGGQLEKRYVRSDGQTVWVRVTELWDPNKQRILCHVADISEVVASRRTARTAAKRAEALFQHSSDLIFVLDAGRRVERVNLAAERLLDSGSRVGQIADSSLGSQVHPDDAARLLATLEKIYARDGLHAAGTFRLKSTDGAWAHVDMVANNQLADPDIVGVILNGRDVTREVTHLLTIGRDQQALVAALSRTVEFRDPYTGGHQRHVAELSRSIAEELGLAARDVDNIVLGAGLHDIGKIAVPAEILARPGRLTPAEYDIVRTHSQIGHEILGDTGLPEQVADIVLHHHERLDGSGYPDALRGEHISLAARIVAVADVLDAMTSHRPYRAGLGLRAARREIRSNAGCLYDKAVVAAALAVTRPKPRPLTGSRSRDPQRVPETATSRSPSAAQHLRARGRR